jgi:hypothetical protein
MSTHVTHINLLQSTAPAHVVGRSLAALLALTLGGITYYGLGLQAQASEAAQRRDDVAQQLKAVQARMAVLNGKQAQSAEVLALRKEIDALRPQAQTASALTHAVSTDTGGRADDFVLALGTLAAVNTQGLWLTAVSVGDGGKRVEVKGEARNGNTVLTFARRANESLKPLSLRLNSLEMQPLSGSAGSNAGIAAVSFHMY